MQVIKEYVAEKKEQIKKWLAGKPTLKMVIVQVGHVPASDRYVRNKAKDANEVNIDCEITNLPEDVTEEALLELLKGLNEDDTVTGYLVQLPAFMSPPCLPETSPEAASHEAEASGECDSAGSWLRISAYFCPQTASFSTSTLSSFWKMYAISPPCQIGRNPSSGTS